MEIICDLNKCTGCGACNDVCPKSAITIKLDRNGFWYPSIDQNACIDCKLCQKTCPINHPERIRENSLRDIETREGWSLKDSIRSKSSSGGIFGQIAHDLLSNGNWKVVGVDFDGKRAFTRMIDSLDEFGNLQNTKYVQAYTSGIYHQVLDELKSGTNILFSGTPCQVGALYSFLYKKKYVGELLTIEVVCHGVPSYHILDKSLDYNHASAAISFRNKENGWGYHSQVMEYMTRDGKIVSKARNVDLFYRYFFGEKKLRPSCYRCPYAKFPRTSDITIGDSWGTNNSSEEEKYKGLSLVIINNEHALEFLNKENNIHLRKIGWFTEIEINRNLYTPFPPIDGSLDFQPTVDIANEIKNVSPEQLLSNTQLGFIEKKEKKSRLIRQIGKVSKKILRHTIGDGELGHLSLLRFKMIVMLMRLVDYSSDLPSKHYLSKKFISITKAVYKSKRI